jgi:hypothetical protein
MGLAGSWFDSWWLDNASVHSNRADIDWISLAILFAVLKGVEHVFQRLAEPQCTPEQQTTCPRSGL